MLSRSLALALIGAALGAPAAADPVSVLFVGNSYTFGRVDPVMSYNAANIDDMTRPRPDLLGANFTVTTGTRAWEPHPWGGVPGIFKQLTVQAGLDYAVSMSARNAASLRGQFLNTASSNWDLRGNVAKGDGFYGADGTYAAAVPQDKINLWWDDYLHASKHGSYLSALVMFGKLTGIDPWSFGANEKAAADLGISPGDAVKLQRVASDQLYAAGVPLVRTPCLHANPRAKGAAQGSKSASACGGGVR